MCPHLLNVRGGGGCVSRALHFRVSQIDVCERKEVQLMSLQLWHQCADDTLAYIDISNLKVFFSQGDLG